MPFARSESGADIKLDAPPTGSLYDDPLSPERSFIADPSTKVPQSSDIDYISGVFTSSPSRVVTQNTLQEIKPTSLSSSDPIDSWVTVFGFSGAQVQPVLQYFKSLGNVINSELGQRNWIHIQYDSPWAAQKALLKNGSVIQAAGSSMIGVIPTRNAMEQVGIASTSFMSPLKKSEFSPQSISPFGKATIPPPSKLSTETNLPPQTPGFPQASLYSSVAMQQQAASQTQAKSLTAIFASEANKAQTTSAQASDTTNGDGFLTKTFNYIFGF